LSRKNGHEIFGKAVEAISEKDVSVDRFAAVLSQDEDFSQTRMDAVADRNIDKAESACDRNRRFAPLFGQGMESLALTAREDYRCHTCHVRISNLIEQRIIYQNNIKISQKDSSPSEYRDILDS
jgi:hypothetical protein